jgi:two-component system invasion response regulator UvrY
MMKILIADDHAIVREGLKQYVKTLDEVKLIDEVDEGNEAWTKIKDGDYDLVILDVSMPGMSGLDVLQKIKERNLPTRVLILSVHPQEQYAFHSFKLGASGYLSKDSASEELILAIKKIASGGRYIASAFAEKIAFNGFDQS